MFGFRFGLARVQVRFRVRDRDRDRNWIRAKVGVRVIFKRKLALMTDESRLYSNDNHLKYSWSRDPGFRLGLGLK